MSPVLIIELVGGAILLALCVATSWIVLRRDIRARIRYVPGWQLLVAAAVAALPWVYFFTRGGHFSIHVDTGLELAALIIALLLAILAFLLYPLAMVITIIVWLIDRRATVA